MNSRPMTLDVEDGVARLVLTRPEGRNAVDEDFATALLDAADRCAADESIRVVLLTATGRFFCVGGDVDAFAGLGENATAVVSGLAKRFHAGIFRLATMAKPLVTAINGPAAGAGLGLAILGDIALAARSAHFTVGYSAIGLTPDGGASWLLPRLIGLRRAQEMVLTNRRVGSEEAAAIGLVTRVVPDEDLAVEAAAVARALACGPTAALGECRRLLLASANADFAAQLAAEAKAIGLAAGSADGREGAAAFVAKRPARFSRSNAG